MDVYATDDEKVEALRKWWSENGRSLIAGIVIGLIVVFGWRAWSDYREDQAAMASAAYSQLLIEQSQNRADAALAQGEQIIAQHSRSPYAVLAALSVAKLKLDKGDTVAARSHLEWAMQNARLSGLEHLARVRLARLLISEGDHENALSLLDSAQPGAFAAEYQELRGDIYRQQGQADLARAAYAEALENLAPGSGNRLMLQMKLDDVAERQQENS